MKSKLLNILIIIILFLCLVGCTSANSNETNNVQINEESNDQNNYGTTMIDDSTITIVYYEKTMKGRYPAVRFNVKNNSNIDINIEPLGIINNLEMTGRFIISNSEGKWASPYIEFKPGESYDVYFGYMDNYSTEQLEMDKFKDMDLSFNVSEKNDMGGWKFLKDYKVHID